MEDNRLHVLVSPTPEGAWLAHVLEFDQAAQAPSADEAIALVPALVTNLAEFLTRTGKPDALWFRAPEDEWRRFDRARKSPDALKLTNPVPRPGGKGTVEECVIGRID